MYGMEFDPFRYGYPSRRNIMYAGKGMVATSQPLAAQAGLEMLKKGGSAVDAAIATAACLTVVEPTSNGIGGDAFALVWADGKLHGLNASGPAPKSITAEALIKAGHREMPGFGWIPVTVPGAPCAWAELSRRFGKLPLTEVLSPAIGYACEGYPVSPTVAAAWERACNMYKGLLKGEEFRHWFETFAPTGKPPAPGEMWRSPAHAETLDKIARTKAEDFYKGDLADRIDSFSRKYGGYLRKEDLEEYSPQWVQPIKINYRGYDVWEIPPNGHGMVALMALNILKGFGFTERNAFYTFHRQIEAVKLAFADGLEYIADPKSMEVPVDWLLSDDYANNRRKLVGDTALLAKPGTPPKGGTVYLAAADGDGNMVSFIQSNFRGFGSGLVVPDTGISLHNRGSGFSLDKSHANCIAPGKKPYHTIIPGFLTKEGKPVGPFGVMGGFMQPQGHVQVIMNSIDFKMNPQDALDAPRWQWVEGKRVFIERQFPGPAAELLEKAGHVIEPKDDCSSFGRGQIIWYTENGIMAGATEPRADGAVAVW
jgi:gamma-glutamyltranspeptidase/glutathione hydrolase